VATRNPPTGEGTALANIPIVGTPLSEDELRQIPKQALFSYSSVKPRRWDIVLDLFVFHARKRTRSYQCPLCKPKDPDITVPVLNACSLGPAGQVYVQCVNGHWADYPCPAP
jgi:hypothetical protein